MTKPFAVCHMMASLDGRIDCAMTEHLGSAAYYEALDALHCDTMFEGRTTVAMHYAAPGVFTEAHPAPLTEESFWKAGDARRWQVVTDTRGTLLWPEETGAERLCLVSRQATKGYLAYLREAGVSYIVAGEAAIDLAKAIDVLVREFGTKRIAVVGGGKLNGSFLKAGLLDEVSMVYGAGIDGRSRFVTAFEGIPDEHAVPYRLQLISAQPMAEDAVWLRYRMKH